MHGAIDKGDVDATGMIGFVAPGDGPIHDAARSVAGRIGRSIAEARAEGGGRVGHAVNFPVDGLNRLALGDVIAAGPPGALNTGR